MLKTPVKTLIAAVFLFSMLTACQSKSAVQYGGTYAYGNPEEGCGQIEIYPENDTTMLFHLYVNRGAPSYNNGEIEGRIVVRDNKSTFRKGFGSMQEECVLQFEFYTDSIRIAMPGDQCECGFGHGVYADGTYLRTSSEVPQFYTTVAGDEIRFDQWQEQASQPEQNSPYSRIDARFIDLFPDLVPGAPFVRGKLLPRQIVDEYLSDFSDEYPQIYVIGKILNYRGLNLLVCELDCAAPDGETQDNVLENNIQLLIYDTSGYALEIDSVTGEAKRAIHQICEHYFGEGGEWTFDSSFAADTTILSAFHQSESESATGYQTPFVNSKRSQLAITPSGDLKTVKTTEWRYSSPFYDRKFLEAQNWGEVADEGSNQTYPTRNNNWQLVNEEATVFPVIVFFHIERIDGVLTPVFSTSESIDSPILFRYAVGCSDNKVEPAAAAPSSEVALIETSDGDLEVLASGKFVLHRR